MIKAKRLEPQCQQYNKTINKIFLKEIPTFLPNQTKSLEIKEEN